MRIVKKIAMSCIGMHCRLPRRTLVHMITLVVLYVVSFRAPVVALPSPPTDGQQMFQNQSGGVTYWEFYVNYNGNPNRYVGSCTFQPDPIDNYTDCSCHTQAGQYMWADEGEYFEFPNVNQLGTGFLVQWNIEGQDYIDEACQPSGICCPDGSTPWSYTILENQWVYWSPVFEVVDS